MARKELPRALTLERFAAGKDGRANAFKKKKQANKRKLFEQAQLKRQYAKLLKKEKVTTKGNEVLPNNKCGETSRSRTADAWESERVAPSLQSPTPKRIANLECDDRDGAEKERQVQDAIKGIKEPLGKRRRRPDPFKGAKAAAHHRRQEMDRKQHERDIQEAEQHSRVKKRKKQRALLSKRTKGGQPVMKHTVQYLLEKIQAQR